MTSTSQDLIGRDVYARDGDKIGSVKDIVYSGEYLVVRRSFFSTIVVPLGVMEDSGGRLTLPFSSSYLDNAPKVDPKYELSPKDKAYLDRFYMKRAA